MSNQPLHYISITETASLIRGGEVSSVEVTQAYLERIDSLNDELGAYISVMGEQALAQARQAEADIQMGAYKGALHGIPVAIKDIVYTKGTPTTGGS